MEPVRAARRASFPVKWYWKFQPWSNPYDASCGTRRPSRRLIRVAWPRPSLPAGVPPLAVYLGRARKSRLDPHTQLRDAGRGVVQAKPTAPCFQASTLGSRAARGGTPPRLLWLGPLRLRPRRLWPRQASRHSRVPAGLERLDGDSGRECRRPLGNSASQRTRRRCRRESGDSCASEGSWPAAPLPERARRGGFPSRGLLCLLWALDARDATNDREAMS